VADDWIPGFLQQEQLPETFRDTVAAICRPLADHAAEWRRQRRRTVIVGLCGAQGSGKSTIAAATVRLLEARGLSALTLSIDDVYLPKAERRRLARDVHPLFATRGPPGTHDVALACTTLDALHNRGPVALPSFDKAADEPRPRSEWRTVQAPVDVVIFEGWCVGARAQDPAALTTPINVLEAQEDWDGAWRAHANSALAGPYQALFARLDALALLQVPGFEVVLGWRREQEHKLIARTGRGMSDTDVDRFIAHYERLTRWILAEAPERADLVFPLAADRSSITKG
jgi:D-glycerate 3-kinase